MKNYELRMKATKDRHCEERSCFYNPDQLWRGNLNANAKAATPAKAGFAVTGIFS